MRVAVLIGLSLIGVVGWARLVGRAPARPTPNWEGDAANAVPFGFGGAAIYLAGILVLFPTLAWRQDCPGTFWSIFGAGRLALAALGFVLAQRISKIKDPLGVFGRPQHLGWALGLYFCVLPVVLLISFLLRGDEPSQDQAIELQASAGLAHQAALFCAICIATPLFEEVIFRGLLLGSIRRVKPAAVAIIASTAMFVVIHDRSVILDVAVLGLFLGFVYDRTRSLWTVVILHALHNTIAFALILSSS